MDDRETKPKSETKGRITTERHEDGSQSCTVSFGCARASGEREEPPAPPPKE